MAKSSSAASSVSSAAKAASISASSVSSSLASAASSASAKASAAATDYYQQHPSTIKIVFLTITITTTAIAGIIAAIYYSGYADDILKAMAKKYYSGKAQTEMLALGKVGEGKAGDMLKGQLKKNPMMGHDELESVQSGLGKEAMGEGLGGVSKKLGGLGGGLAGKLG